MTDHAPDNGPPAHLRIREPASAVEIAAVVMALDATAAARRRSQRRPPTPAWSRAARREGLGASPAAEPSDLATR